MAKETIYTIPINEAFEEDSECPLCVIEKKLEKDAVQYALGPAMMEPDHREESNEKGYCNKHFSMLFAAENKLPLALVLDTHLDSMLKLVSAMKSPEKKSIFKKSEDKNPLFDAVSSCMICEKIDRTMERYARVLCDMYETDAEFRQRFSESKGFCLPHFERLYRCAKSTEFKKALAEKEEQELLRIKDDIHKFTLKFDYRNRDMEWGTAKDAPKRTTEKIGGYIASEDE